jgi:REP element-mobilizing transposase RayT
MIAGFHLIWTAYGWWLPNEPRGSSSHEIRVERIADLGELHYGRKLIQPPSRELRAFYTQARQVLKHPLLIFEEEERRIISDSFRKVIAAQRYTCFACAIMPDHVHAVIRKPKHHAETMIENLEAASREALVAAGRRAVQHPVWGGPGWKVFLNTQEDIRAASGTSRRIPAKEDFRTSIGISSRFTTAGSRGTPARNDKSPS